MITGARGRERASTEDIRSEDDDSDRHPLIKEMKEPASPMYLLYPPTHPQPKSRITSPIQFPQRGRKKRRRRRIREGRSKESIANSIRRRGRKDGISLGMIKTRQDEIVKYVIINTNMDRHLIELSNAISFKQQARRLVCIVHS
jgi:hypothetical protein